MRALTHAEAYTRCLKAALVVNCRQGFLGKDYLNFKSKHRPSSLRFYGVMVSTLDFESSDPSSNLGRT